MRLAARVTYLITTIAVLGLAAGAWAEEPSPIIPLVQPADPPQLQKDAERILGVIPNYTTVSNPNAVYVPLTPKQKWGLFIRESVDPFNVVNAAIGAGFSQVGNQTPKYGEGGAAFGSRYGAALADLSTQNFFSSGVLACLLHQDPRYFRMGPEHRILTRIGYSFSRVVIARQDSGKSAFNSSGIFGMMLGIGASNLYYPAASMREQVMMGRLTTSLTGSVTGNLLSEFWPDMQKLLHRKKPRS